MEREMTIKEAVISFWKKGLDFKGRARRREYWLSLLGHCMIGFLLYALTIIVDILTGFRMNITENIFFNGLNIFYYISFIPAMAIGVRRLHDINWSGTLCIISNLLYLPAAILENFYEMEKLANFTTTIGMIYSVMSLVAYVIGFVLLLLAMKEGTHGPNKYGDDPKYMKN